MQKIIIAAVAENDVIGKDGDIPWHYSEDMKHFKQKTTGHSVIMGRKTYFSLPEDFRPLPDRKNIVLSRSEPELPESVELANSLDEAWEKAEEHSSKAFVIGGAGVYEQTMQEADRMILTEVHEEYDGDTFFPEWSKDSWKEIKRDDREELSFVEYRKTV
ncbi:MAG: dihydrofolate reductase [Nanohaloarchaea archaeon QH_8_44_6]|nr:MAG: dihydrofolate reductase [Nanohaloarchaea archaeon QH_8_44_6]